MRDIRGYVYMFGAVMCFGALPVFAKLAYGAGFEPLQLLIVRMALALIVLVVLCFITGRSLAVPVGSRLSCLAVSGAYGCMSLLFFTGCQGLDAGVANGLLHLSPLMVLAMGVIVGRRFFWLQWAGVAMAIVGFFLLANFQGGISSGSGVALVLAAAFFSAANTIGVASERLRGIDSYVLAFYACVITLVFSLVLFWGVPNSVGAWSIPGVFWAFVLAVVSTVFALTLYIQAARLLGPAKSSLLGNGEVVVSLVLGAVLLDEVLTWQNVIGCLCVVVSCLLAGMSGSDASSAGKAGLMR